MQADDTNKSEETTSALSSKTSSDKDRSVGLSNLHIEATRENEISNVHYGFAQAIDVENQITVDTVSSISVINDPPYCDKTEKSD